MFSKILVVDNTSFINTLSSVLVSDLDASIETMSDYSNTDLESISKYNLYVIRLDEQTKEIIKYISNLNKLIIVLTDKDTKKSRKEILSLGIADYVITNSESSYKEISALIKRLDSNSSRTILTVDDSKVSLIQIAIILETQNLNYVQCTNGQEALEYLKNPNSKKIDLVVTDYEMPVMNGYELVANIRKEFYLEELPVLVISGSEDAFMISKFLKAGANDYINKPFIHEELIARITNSLTLVGMFTKIKSMAMTDYLTGLHNRIYFYDVGATTLQIAKRANHPVAIAMIDIDDFKHVNDSYGHEVGDKALIHVGDNIKKALRRSDIFVRFGGEEFVVFLPNCPHKQALDVMNKVCNLVEKSPLKVEEDKNLTMTISIGVTSDIDTLDNMIKTADEYMYIAKENGKNRVYPEN